MTVKPVTYRELEVMRENLEAREHQYLREKGWQYTCNTPGSFWLWQKKVGDTILALELHHAISVQSHLDVN
jgi:hypothetical protein